MLPKINRTKRLIEESILFAISYVSKDITNHSNLEENFSRAETITELSEAYNLVHRGKRGDR